MAAVALAVSVVLVAQVEPVAEAVKVQRPSPPVPLVATEVMAGVAAPVVQEASVVKAAAAVMCSQP